MTDPRDSLLDSLLPLTVFDGWTEGALQQAAMHAGVSAFEARRAFARPVDAIDYFTARADRAMVESLTADPSYLSLKIRERIAQAVMLRFHQQAGHREAVRRAMAVYAMPWNATHALQSLYATVDVIWRAAGDTSTDWNFYTKRLLLSKVYSTSLRIWLDDTTPGLSETEAFLRRRIENVMQIEKFKARTRDSWGKLERWLPKRRA